MTGMACRISELVIDAADPERLAVFWSEVLGYVELGREDDGSIEIGPPDAGFGGPQPTLVFGPSSDPRLARPRRAADQVSWLTSPCRAASAAGRGQTVGSLSMARWWGRREGRRMAPPSEATRPRATSGRAAKHSGEGDYARPGPAGTPRTAALPSGGAMACLALTACGRERGHPAGALHV